MVAKWRRRWAGSGAERGQALVLFAGGLAAFIALVGLAVDIGQLVVTRTELQKTADAAALAGAQELPGSTTSARTTAGQYAGLNTSGLTPEISFTGNSIIHVEAEKRVDYFFLGVIGLDGATVGARASAFAEQQPVTGYHLQSTAPFIIWGGSRESEVHAGDQYCPLHTCVGRSYSFLDNQWMDASGDPIGPDWTANGSNNFKGDINHGAGNPVVQIGDALTVSSQGGLGSVNPPAVGSTIVLPVASRATGNSNNRTFTIGAWVLVRVDSGCKKQGCTGTILGPTTAPDGAVTDGNIAPPPSLGQTLTVTRLTE